MLVRFESAQTTGDFFYVNSDRVDGIDWMGEDIVGIAVGERLYTTPGSPDSVAARLGYTGSVAKEGK